MKIRKAFKISLILLCLTLVAVSVALSFMPQQVVLHYDFNGNADSVGSKYFFLLFPLFATVLWLVLFYFSNRFARKNEISNEKITHIVSCCAMGLFLCMEIFCFCSCRFRQSFA